MVPAGVTISTQTISSNVWSRQERVLSTTVSKGGVPYHREGGRYDSEPERSQRGAIEDDDSPTTTITCLCTNGKEG